MDADFKFKDLPYKRLDLDEVRDRYRTLMEQLSAAPTFEKQEKVHGEYYEFSEHINTVITLAHIRRDADMTDKFYEKEAAFYDRVMPEIADLDNRYHRILLRTPFKSRWESRIGRTTFVNMELSEKGHDERIIPLLQEENALVTRYEKIISTARIPFMGGVYNLPLMSKFTTGADRKLRRDALKAIDAFFSSVTSEIDEIFDRLVKCRTSQARAMGHSSFVELGYMRMHRSCYGRKEVDALRKEVKEHIVPLCNRINERRRERLGVDSLKLYDQCVYFKEGNPVPVIKGDDILAKGLELYRGISPLAGEFFEYMLGHELFDVAGGRTKKAAGYMTYLGEYKSPFIFANFNGTNEDIGIITHECGHAFQGYLLRNEPVREAAELPMDLAEIHSVAMEYFTDRGMEAFFGERAGDYRRMHFEDSVLLIPYGCMVDEFQHIIYDRPFMSTGERKQAWKMLEETYRPHIDFEGTPHFAGGGYWQRQHHIFSTPFYYIDYVLAALCAMQYRFMMDEDYGGAFASYVELCGMSGRYSFTETLSRAGLASPFAEGYIKEIAGKIEKI